MAETNYSEELRKGEVSTYEALLAKSNAAVGAAQAALVAKSHATNQRVLEEDALNEFHLKLANANRNATNALNAKLFGDNAQQLSIELTDTSAAVVSDMSSVVVDIKSAFESLAELNSKVSGYLSNADSLTGSPEGTTPNDVLDLRARIAQRATRKAFDAAKQLLQASLDANIAANQNRASEVHSSATGLQSTTSDVQSLIDGYQKSLQDEIKKVTSAYEKAKATESAAVELFSADQSKARGIAAGLRRMNWLLNGDLSVSIWSKDSASCSAEFSEGLVAEVTPPEEIYLPPNVVVPKPPAKNSGDKGPTGAETEDGSKPVEPSTDLPSDSVPVQSVWFVAVKAAGAAAFNYKAFYHLHKNPPTRFVDGKLEMAQVIFKGKVIDDKAPGKKKDGKLAVSDTDVAKRYDALITTDSDGDEISRSKQKLGSEYVVYAFYSPHLDDLPSSENLAFNTYLSLPSKPFGYQFPLVYGSEDRQPTIKKFKKGGGFTLGMTLDAIPLPDQHESPCNQEEPYKVIYQVFLVQSKVYESLQSDFLAAGQEQEQVIAELMSPVNYTTVDTTKHKKPKKSKSQSKSTRLQPPRILVKNGKLTMTYQLFPPSAQPSYTDMYGQYLETGVDYVALVLAVAESTIKNALPNPLRYGPVLSKPSCSFTVDPLTQNTQSGKSSDTNQFAEPDEDPSKLSAEPDAEKE